MTISTAREANCASSIATYAPASCCIRRSHASPSSRWAIRTTANIWNDSISLIGDARVDIPFFYEVRYADILANPKTEITKLIEFCGTRSTRSGPAPGQYADFEVVETICRKNMRKYGYL